MNLVARRALATLAVLAWLAGHAVAQIVMDQPASILVWPKIVARSGHDTIIQITNTSNALRAARCFYADLSASPTEFDITLTRQQPTFWVASQGRSIDNALPGSLNNLIPATSGSFQGELLCVETEETGAPFPGNDLLGEATLIDTSSGDVAKYHAVGFLGNPENVVSGNVLCLGGDVSPSCPNGADYSGCPQTWFLDHLADGAADSVIGDGSAVHTNLTVVPCTQDLTSRTPPSVRVNFAITSQFETSMSTSKTFVGWTDSALGAIDSAFTRANLGSDYAQTQMSAGGFLVLAQEFHDSGPPASLTASAAINPHAQGQRSGQDTIVLPDTSPPPPGTEIFSPQTLPAGLAGITGGPDGNLWFTEMFANQIGRITPTGSISEFPLTATADPQPTAITKGPDGNIWFTEAGANQVGRISTDGSVMKEFRITAVANAITAGPDGNLWFTEPSINSIGRIAPDGSSPTDFQIGTEDRGLSSIAQGSDGNLWFTESAADMIGRIAPNGSGITEFAASNGPDSITLGPDGNLWFVETAFGASQIGRLTPSGTVSEFSALAPPTSIASASDGNLWFTSGTSFGTPCVLGRVMPTGVVTAFFNACGTAVTGGPDGNVWFTGFFPEQIVRFSLAE